MSSPVQAEPGTPPAQAEPGPPPAQAEPSAPPAPPPTPDREPERKRPLYPRLLRLRHIEPSGWQRAVLGEGALALAVLLALADLVSAWTLVVLPLAVALVVKAHDLVAGALDRRATAAVPDPGRAAR